MIEHQTDLTKLMERYASAEDSLRSLQHSHQALVAAAERFGSVTEELRTTGSAVGEMAAAVAATAAAAEQTHEAIGGVVESLRKAKLGEHLDQLVKDLGETRRDQTEISRELRSVRDAQQEQGQALAATETRLGDITDQLNRGQRFLMALVVITMIGALAGIMAAVI